MRQPSPQPAERVTVQPAPPALAGWCLCAIVRRVDAGPVQARVQASTWASLNVVVQGEVHGAGGVLPPRFLTAPFPVPFETCTPGPLLSIPLVLQPWALEPLTGVAAGAIGPLPLALPLSSRADTLLAALQAACATPDLSGLWQVLHAEHERVRHATPSLALDILTSAGVEAAAQAKGWSPRHYLRRFRHAMGLPPATWARIRRWETALRDLATTDESSIAQLSLRHGFADQAHLARDTRALVDETPVRLRRLLHGDGAPWALQPAHVRFVQDGEGAQD